MKGIIHLLQKCSFEIEKQKHDLSCEHAEMHMINHKLQWERGA